MGSGASQPTDVDGLFTMAKEIFAEKPGNRCAKFLCDNLINILTTMVAKVTKDHKQKSGPGDAAAPGAAGSGSPSPNATRLRMAGRAVERSSALAPPREEP